MAVKSFALTLRERIKQLIMGLTAGTAIGALILGIGGRLVMRLIAIMGQVAPGASLSGSLEVIAFGSLVGGAGGVGYLILQKWLPSKQWISGLLLGIIIYGLLLVIPFDSKLAAKGFPQLQAMVHLLFGGLCMVFGLLLVPVLKWLEARWIN